VAPVSDASRNDRDRVLEATDLVGLVGEHVRLTQKGREHLGLCPFHDDRHPSMAVVTHKGIPFFKCFSCGAAGNAIDFMMRYHRLDYGAALRQLAERSGIALTPWHGERNDRRDERGALLRAHEVAERAFRRFLADPDLGAEARAMLDRRGVAEAMRERFGIGCAPTGWDHLVSAIGRHLAHARGGERSDGEALTLEQFGAAGLVRRSSRGDWIDGFRHRVLFPIRNEMGRTVAFGGRQIDPEDQPKYLNSPESPIFEKSATLFGIDLAKQAIIRRRMALVVEGYLDVVACHGAGFEHTVATLGTALTAGHARLLRHKAEVVVLLFDGDEAGQRAADRAVEVFLGGSVDVRIAVLPGGLDPDDLLKQPDGAASLQSAIDAAIDSLEFLLRRFRAQWVGIDSISGRQNALEAMLRRLADLGLDGASPLRRSMVLQNLSHLSGLSAERLYQSLRRQAPRRAAERERPADLDASPETDEPPSGDLRPLPPAERIAERSLLAVLIAWPELLDASAEAAERLETGLRDPIAAAAATWLTEARQVASQDRGEPILSDLLTALPPQQRSELDDLLELAEGRPRLGESPQQQLQQALDDLRRLERIEAWRSERAAAPTASDPAEAARRLALLREGGGRAAAIGRIARPA
jgi:DNA primase